MPSAVTIHLIFGVEAAPLDEALRETQSHGSVVGPFAGFEIERTAADNIRYWFKSASGFEFQGGTQRIADRQSQKGAAALVTGHLEISRSPGRQATP